MERRKNNKKINKNMKQRMYVLVPYNLSPIQKGIQALHAVVEYGNKYKDTEEYLRWATIDKTVIILDGGTSNHSFVEGREHLDSNDYKHFKGSMDNYYFELRSKGYKVSPFCEEDINDALTGVAFIADERVWDKETYPDFDHNSYSKVEKITGNEYKEDYDKWLENIGGETNLFLREFLITKKLAN